MISQNLALAAQRLAQDVVTGEVVEAMRRRGVRPLLIKGPVLERWLYQDGTKRSYGDIDLVVAPDRFDDAETVLGELGFAVPVDVSAHIDLVDYEHDWVRRGHSIDLHRGIWGLNGDPDTVWRVLSENVDQLVIAGTSVEVPNVAVCAMLVAVHAVAHGKVARPREDLRRALCVADESMWRAAARLAERVDALGRFAMGLCLLPAGQELVADLRLPVAGSVDDYLHVAGEVGVAGGFQRLAQAPTRRVQLAMLIDELWPSNDYMRWQHPLARRRRGMTAAHLGRLAWLFREAPRAWLAWRRAVNAAGRLTSGEADCLDDRGDRLLVLDPLRNARDL